MFVTNMPPRQLSSDDTSISCCEAYTQNWLIPKRRGRVNIMVGCNFDPRTERGQSPYLGCRREKDGVDYINVTDKTS